MCTVTYIPCGDAIYLTSNRDEKQGRLPAIPPTAYRHSSGRIMYPRDGDAGGSWIACHQNGNSVVLLNGAFEPHVSKPPYRRSRGLVLIDLINNPGPLNVFQTIGLNDIEPFTAIITDKGELFECRWDGKRKHFITCDPGLPHIWSSVTLYNRDMILKRRRCFEQWLPGRKITQKDILHFHQFTGDGDVNNDLLINRDGEVFTVSITSMAVGTDRIRCEYLDLIDKKTFSHELVSAKSMTVR